MLEGGKHLLCEKPLAVDGNEGEKILAVAKAHPNQVWSHIVAFAGTSRGPVALQLSREGREGRTAWISIKKSKPTAWQRCSKEILTVQCSRLACPTGL